MTVAGGNGKGSRVVAQQKFSLEKATQTPKSPSFFGVELIFVLGVELLLCGGFFSAILVSQRLRSAAASCRASRHGGVGQGYRVEVDTKQIYESE